MSHKKKIFIFILIIVVVVLIFIPKTQHICTTYQGDFGNYANVDIEFKMYWWRDTKVTGKIVYEINSNKNEIDHFILIDTKEMQGLGDKILLSTIYYDSNENNMQGCYILFSDDYQVIQIGNSDEDFLKMIAE